MALWAAQENAGRWAGREQPKKEKSKEQVHGQITLLDFRRCFGRLNCRSQFQVKMDEELLELAFDGVVEAPCAGHLQVGLGERDERLRKSRSCWRSRQTQWPRTGCRARDAGGMRPFCTSADLRNTLWWKIRAISWRSVIVACSYRIITAAARQRPCRQRHCHRHDNHHSAGARRTAVETLHFLRQLFKAGASCLHGAALVQKGQGE